MDPMLFPLAASLAGTAGAAVSYVREVNKNNRRAKAARAAGEPESWNPEVYSQYPATGPNRNISKAQFR